MKSLREKSMGEKRKSFCQEICEKWKKKKIHAKLYIEKHEAQWIERYQEVSRFTFRQMELSRSYQEVSIAKWPRWIEKLSRQILKNFDGSKLR